MPLGEEAVTVSGTETEDRAVAYLVRRGAPPAAARLQARHLIEAELRGHPSHGLRRLAVLGSRIENGLLDPAAEPSLEWISTVAVRVDGRRGFGPVAAHRAIDALLPRVRESGVAVGSLHGTHHLGMLSPYIERIAHAGAIGVVLSSTEGLVHPWGGAGALLGTNPIGIGIPADGGDLALDMSSGAVSAGKILDYRAKGLPLPDGWAVDSLGRPTTDAASAADGAISPFGGAKGYALGLALGAMVGAVTGTALGADVHGTLDTDQETSKGDVILVLSPALLAGTDTRTALGRYFDTVRASGVDGPVTIPGERARIARDAALASGLRLAPDVWDLLVSNEPHDEPAGASGEARAR